MIIIYFI